MRTEMANEACSAELALIIIIPYPTSASGIILLLKTPTKYQEKKKKKKTTIFFSLFLILRRRADAYNYHIWRASGGTPYNGLYGEDILNSASRILQC